MSALTKVPGALCLVADRAHAPDILKACNELGGGWREGGQLWEKAETAAYLVLLAHDPRRIARAAPLVMLARDQAALAVAVTEACKRLDDVACAWVSFLTDEARALVTRIILADSVPEGHA